MPVKRLRAKPDTLVAIATQWVEELEAEGHPLPATIGRSRLVETTAAWLAEQLSSNRDTGSGGLLVQPESLEGLSETQVREGLARLPAIARERLAAQVPSPPPQALTDMILRLEREIDRTAAAARGQEQVSGYDSEESVRASGRLEEALQELGTALAEQTGLEDLLRLVARGAAQMARADSAVVCLADEDGPMRVRAQYSATGASGLPLDLCTQLTAAAEAEGKPVLWATAGRLPAEAREAFRLSGTKRCLGLPLAHHGASRGALLLCAARPDVFPAAERGMLECYAGQAVVGIDHIRQFNHLQRLVVELTDLTWVSAQMAATLDLTTVLETMVQAVAKAAEAPAVGVALRGEDGLLRLPANAYLGLPPEFVEGFGAREMSGLAAEALAGAPVCVPDVAASPYAEDPLLRGLQAGAAVCVPLGTQESARGVLWITYPEPRPFPRNLTDLLWAYAVQASLAVENAVLYGDKVTYLNQLSTVFELTQAVTSSLELQQVLDRVLVSVSSLLEAPVTTIMLRERESGTLTLRATRGLPASHLAGQLGTPSVLERQAVELGTIVTSRDLAKDGRFRPREAARREGLRSIICAPLTARGETVGVISAYTREVRDFSESDRRLLQTLANQAGIAIENARLYEQATERAQFLSSLMAEVHHRIRNNLQTVIGFLAMQLTDERNISRTQALEESIQRIRTIALVHGLLSEEQMGSVDMKEVARSICEMARQQMVEPGRNIGWGVAGARLLLPSHRATSLALAINELVTNAFRHAFGGREKGRVTVSLQQDSDRYLIQVRDDGIGLPEGFDPAQGAGMGLRVVRGVVEQDLGGRFELRGGKGEGVTARLTLPK
jgi:two-component sensor histidine kinase